MGDQGPWENPELLEIIQVCEYHEPHFKLLKLCIGLIFFTLTKEFVCNWRCIYKGLGEGKNG
jgi:hypothetical protein